MRIAIGGIHIECSTANPVLTHAHDFKVIRKDEFYQHPNFRYLQVSPHQLFPVLHARAIPGGPVSGKAYAAFKQELLDGLRAALPLDGVYLALHGAMFVEGLRDAEGDLVSAVRSVVGSQCLLVASFDLHANLSRRLIDNLDGLTNYRTAPHIDVIETQRRAFQMLSRCLESGRRPRLSWAPIPVLLPGERTSTEDEPARTLYASLKEYDATPGVLEAALFVGYVWADEPRATASAVITGLDMPQQEQERLTAELALTYWQARQSFSFGTEAKNLEAAVRAAKSCSTGPVILADSGDNPTGGGVGDHADVLSELLKQQAEDVLVAGITDAPAVEQCFRAGLGASVSLMVGGTLDANGGQCHFTGEVKRLDTNENRQAVVVGQGITLVLSAKRRPYHFLRDFAELGLDPREFKIVVVKSGYLSPELAPLANPSLLILSDGVVNQDIPRLNHSEIQRPMYPWDNDFGWRPKVTFGGLA